MHRFSAVVVVVTLFGLSAARASADTLTGDLSSPAPVSSSVTYYSPVISPPVVYQTYSPVAVQSAPVYSYRPILSSYPTFTSYSPIVTSYSPIVTSYSPIVTSYRPMVTTYRPIRVAPRRAITVYRPYRPALPIYTSYYTSYYGSPYGSYYGSPYFVSGRTVVVRPKYCSARPGVRRDVIRPQHQQID